MLNLKSLASVIFIYCVSYNSLSAEVSPISEPSAVRSLEPINTEDDEVPLDAWIIHKKEEGKGPPSAIPSVGNSQQPVSVDEEAEEKRIYKALLEDYQKEVEAKVSQKKTSRNKNKTQDVFKKTIMSKRDIQRIEKIKKVQRQVVFEQKNQFIDLLRSKKEKDSTLRYCVLNYPVIGLPSEVRKLDAKILNSKITNDWKNGLKLIVQSGCQVVLYTGIFGKTTTKINEFVDKTVEYIGLGGGTTWKVILNSGEANSTFAVFYDTTSVEIFKSESLTGLMLRKGGLFQETDFSLAPLEITIEKKNETRPKRYSIINFDLRDKSSPLKKPKLHHQMQMASTLLEASLSRINQKNDESVILTGFIGENRSHPAFQVLQGVIAPVDFLEGKACQFVEIPTGETVGKSLPLFTCDTPQLNKSARIMLGLFSELSSLFGKQDKIALNKNLNKLDSEFFIDLDALESIKSTDNNKLLGASFDVIKGKQFDHTFFYVDLLGGAKD